MLTHLCLLTLLILTPLQAWAQPHPERPPVIDVHLHCYAEDARWRARVPNPVTGKPLTATSEREHLRATLDEMDRYNVVLGAVSNDYAVALRWQAAAPGRIIASYAIEDPAAVDLAFLRREHAAGRLRMIGEVSPQYIGIAPNDPRMEPIYALAEELDVPVGLHIGPGPPGAAYVGSPKYRMALTDPLLLEDVLVRHPRLRLYVMHAGWPMLDRMIALMYAHPQVYVDIGVIDWTQPRKEFHRYLRGMVEAGYGKRILFGSDQMVWPEAIGMAVENIESADFLTAEQKRDILYNNAVKFLKLDERALGRPRR